jgi:hypothetical protein
MDEGDSYCPWKKVTADLPTYKCCHGRQWTVPIERMPQDELDGIQSCPRVEDIPLRTVSFKKLLQIVSSVDVERPGPNAQTAQR